MRRGYPLERRLWMTRAFSQLCLLKQVTTHRQSEDLDHLDVFLVDSDTPWDNDISISSAYYEYKYPKTFRV